MTKEDIVQYFDLFSNLQGQEIEKWLSAGGNDIVFSRLSILDDEPLTMVQLNQMFMLSGIQSMTYGFFKYYWLSVPDDTHTYKVSLLEDFEHEYGKTNLILSCKQLRWGIRRLYTDALLFFGNIDSGYEFLSTLKETELITFFGRKRFATDAILNRGKTLKFIEIPKENRYLISEFAYKNFDSSQPTNLKTVFVNNFKNIKNSSPDLSPTTIAELFDKELLISKDTWLNSKPMKVEFFPDDVLENNIESETDIDNIIDEIVTKYDDARFSALYNTKLYLSLVHDLDVYVATSMRSKKDFDKMADYCDKIFKDPKIKQLNLRYFDPTISAADGHEDKGLIECLMVKCAKVLIYIAEDKDSYGKDAEAAMALTSGKPVLFFCPEEIRKETFKKYHPLTKLIDFSTGVANGAIVATTIPEVVELISRIYNNKMEYSLEQPKKGYFNLTEKTTKSIVRIQTNNSLLTKSFWNYFNRFIISENSTFKKDI